MASLSIMTGAFLLTIHRFRCSVFSFQYRSFFSFYRAFVEHRCAAVRNFH